MIYVDNEKTLKVSVITAAILGVGLYINKKIKERKEDNNGYDEKKDDK